MSEKQNKLQKLEQLSDSYQVEKEVAEKAILQIEKQKAKQNAEKRKPIFKVAYSCIALVCVVVVSLAVYFGVRPAPVAYFDSASVQLSTVEDISQVIKDYNATVKYFNESGSANKKGIIKDSGKLGYIEQKIFFTSLWDNMHFRAVVLENADFDFESNYKNCTFEYKHSDDVNVYYVTDTKANSFGLNDTIIDAKFIYQRHEYFMSIQSAGEVEPTEKIAYYVDLLINN